MWKYNSPEELYHWGILGMHWGHHKSSTYNGPILSFKKTPILGIRAFGTTGADARKAKANEKVNKINKKRPGSKAYLDAKIRADKINTSRYGKTNGRLITEGLLKGVATLGIASLAAKTFIKLGKPAVASWISTIGSGALLGNEINSYIRVGANYRDKRRKN